MPENIFQAREFLANMYIRARQIDKDNDAVEIILIAYHKVLDECLKSFENHI